MPSTQVASKDTTPPGSVHKSRGDRVVCTVKQVLKRGKYGDVYVFASTLCKYNLRKGDLFVVSLARV